MIRIGDFARMARVSVATLRLYDEQGLVKPRSVDTGSGYRLYESEQLVDLHRIAVLKSFGFTLREIKSVLHDNVKPEGMSELLAQKRKFAEAQLQTEIQKMKRLELQIQIIEGLQTMTIADVQTLTVPEITAVAVHLVIPTNDQAGAMIGPAFDHLYGSLHQQGIQPQGSCMTVWKSNPDTVTDEELDVVVPIEPGITPADNLKLITLPSQLVATVTHRGPFSEFQTCHIVLKEWLAANRYALGGSYREIYHTPPGDESVTEVQYPIIPL
jgi:DNA-binding transcriptional MerR regulator